MDEELWRQTEYKHYQISNMGRVKSMPRQRVKEEKILKQSFNGNYYHVEINKKTVLVHRLVAKAFCNGETEERNMVNHKDRNKLNNKATNLEWCSNSENQQNRNVNGCITHEHKKCRRRLVSGEFREHIYEVYRVSYSIACRKVVSKTFKDKETAELYLTELKATYPR